MIGQVQMINGVKTIVPVTDTTPVDEVTVGNMQSVSSNAVARALGNYFDRQEQAWNTTHSYTLDVNGSYVLFLLSPFMLATDIWFVKARHSSGISGYWQAIMKSYNNANYNLSITNDTLTITGDSCQTCLIKINYAYA